MPEYLRVKHKVNGSESSILKHMYDFAPDEYELLANKPAVNSGGRPLPAKPKTTASKAAAKKTTATGSTNSATQETASADEAGQSAETQKEN